MVREANIEEDRVNRYVKEGSLALPEFIRLLDKENIAVKTISLSEPTLDDVFLRKTGRSSAGYRGDRPGGRCQMKFFRDIGLLFKRSFTQALRNGIWVVVGISTPLLYLVLFTPLLQKLVGGPGFPGSNALDIFLPGILAFLAFGSGNGPDIP